MSSTSIGWPASSTSDDAGAITVVRPVSTSTRTMSLPVPLAAGRTSRYERPSFSQWMLGPNDPVNSPRLKILSIESCDAGVVGVAFWAAALPARAAEARRSGRSWRMADRFEWLGNPEFYAAGRAKGEGGVWALGSRLSARDRRGQERSVVILSAAKDLASWPSGWLRRGESRSFA